MPFTVGDYVWVLTKKQAGTVVGISGGWIRVLLHGTQNVEVFRAAELTRI